LDALFPLANRHGVAPLVSRALSRVPAGAELRRDRESDVRRALIFTAELSRLLDLFGEADIPLIPLRGPVLGSLLYGDVAARECSDLDILVRRADLARAKETLVAAGYAVQLAPLHEECALRWGFEISL